MNKSKDNNSKTIIDPGLVNNGSRPNYVQNPSPIHDDEDSDDSVVYEVTIDHSTV